MKTKETSKQYRVVMLSTEESMIHKHNISGLIFDSIIPASYCELYNNQPKHLYVVSNEEVKVNDWYLDNTMRTAMHGVNKCDTKRLKEIVERFLDRSRKIIATTDPKLIEDGIPEINSDFIEEYIKRQRKIEEVDIHKIYDPNLAPIVREFYKYVILAHNEVDYRIKCDKIAGRVDNGFYTKETCPKITIVTIKEKNIAITGGEMSGYPIEQKLKIYNASKQFTEFDEQKFKAYTSKFKKEDKERMIQSLLKDVLGLSLLNNFLNNYPVTESNKGIKGDHVIVDKDNWEEIRNILKTK